MEWETCDWCKGSGKSTTPGDTGKCAKCKGTGTVVKI